MRVLFSALAMGALTFTSTAAAEKSDFVYPGAKWDFVAPEDVGFSSEKLLAVKVYFEEIGGDALFAVRHGAAFLAWGEVNEPIDNYSIRKSYLNALLGIEYGKGNLDLDATLTDLDIDDREGLTAAEREARVRDLLTTTSGVYHPGSYESKEQKGARPPRGTFKRGEFFYYNNWDFNVLGHVFESAAGADIFTSLKARIAEPIGMQDFDLEQATYRHDDTSAFPAYTFASSARDDARFGYLYLRGGRWRNQQLIPEEWVAMSTSRQVMTGRYYYYDYGFLWWVDEEHGMYFARGNSGQFIAVMPGLDLVIVFRADPGSIIQKWLGRRVSPQDSFSLIPKILGAMVKGG